MITNLNSCREFLSTPYIPGQIFKKEYIESQITSTWAYLRNLRENERGWQDYINKENMISIGEAIESFLVPAQASQSLMNHFISTVSINELKEWFEGLFKFAGIPSGLSDETQKLDTTPFAGGSYLNDNKRLSDQVIDAANFALTASLRFKRMFDVSTDPEFLKKLDLLIDKSIVFINDSFSKDGGWAWSPTGNTHAYLYHTYITLDSITDDFLPLFDEPGAARYLTPKCFELKQEIVNKVDAARGWLLKTYVSISSARNIESEFIKSDDGVGNIYLNLWATYAAITNDPNNSLIKGALSFIIKEMKDKDLWDYSFEFSLNSGEDDVLINKWTDACLTPLTLKAVAAAAHRSVIDKVTARNWIELLWNKLNTTLRNSDLVGLWPSGPSTQAKIYFTERCIEALVATLSYVESFIPQIKTTDHSTSKALRPLTFYVEDNGIGSTNAENIFRVLINEARNDLERYNNGQSKNQALYAKKLDNLQMIEDDESNAYIIKLSKLFRELQNTVMMDEKAAPDEKV